MEYIVVKKGSADISLYVNLVDPTDGVTPETGLTVTDLDIQVTRNLTASDTLINAIVGTGGAATHVDDKIFELDATSSPGLHLVCLRDAAFATGVDKVILAITGAAIKPVYILVQLVDYDPEDAASLGLTTLSNQALIVETGTAAAGTLSKTQMTTNLTNASNGIYDGQVLKFNGDTTTTALQKQAAVISGYDGGLKMLTFSGLTVAPSDTETFQII